MIPDNYIPRCRMLQVAANFFLRLVAWLLVLGCIYSGISFATYSIRHPEAENCYTLLDCFKEAWLWR